MNSPIQDKRNLNQQPVESLDLSNLSFSTGLQGVIQDALGISNKRGQVTSESELSEGPQSAQSRINLTVQNDPDRGTLNPRGSITRFSSLSA